MENAVKNLLVHGTIRSASAPEHGIDYALALAASQRARVSFLLSEVEPRSAPFADPDNMQGGSETERVQTSRRADIEQTSRLLNARASEQDVWGEILVSDAQDAVSAGAQLARHARLRDLVVVSVYGPLQYPLLDLIEAVLFRTGRPLVLVPTQAGPFRSRTVAIAWDAT